MDRRPVQVSDDNPSIQRILEKCVKCGVCYNTCTQEVGIDREKYPKLCINCGTCILNCPMGALKEKYDYKTVLNLVKDTEKVVTISIAPAVRVALGEELGMDLGVSTENILPAILKSIGFSYVFDVAFGADVTIMEEASELVSRIKNGGVLPMFTSCCPAWVKYAKNIHPELIPNISTTKSPIGIMSSLIKTYFKEMMNIEKDIISVVVAPCTAKKMEILSTDTDYVITTRELALMIKECEIDIDSLKLRETDILLGCGSKTGLLFGRSGGVMEAALSVVHYLLTGKIPMERTYHIEVDGPITEKKFKIGSRVITVGVIYGLKNLEHILDDLEKYDFIEVMNCNYGCVGGGGQPLSMKQDAEERRIARAEALDNTHNNVPFPFMNKEVEELYDSYLIHPMSEKSEKLLHTKHQ